MRRLPIQPFRRKASSLVVTLLVIVVLSTIVVAFMQSMAIERLTAKSLKNIFQAELAAQAGYEAAVRQMEFAMGTNQAFVNGLTNYATGYGPVVMIGRTNLTNAVQLMPLVSATNSITNYSTPAWPPALTNYLVALTGTNTTDINTRSRFIQNTNNTNFYRAAWVPLTNSSGQTNARYAYIVLDEHARLNPVIHNGMGVGATNTTNWYTGSWDIALTNAAGSILTSIEATNAKALTNFLWTPETFGQAFAARINYDSVKHLLTASANPTFDVIPASMANGGRPKYNINDVVTNFTAYEPSSTSAAETIGRLISTNLPVFSSRDPSLRGIAANERRYLFRLAANIVDYIDADSLPTLVNGGEPAGKDLYPLITAIAQRFRRTAMNTNSDPITATFESQCFIQVWNPYSSPATLSNVPIRFVLKNQMNLIFGTGIVDPFDDYDKTITTNLTVRPNEMAILEFGNSTQSWSGPGPAASLPYVTNSSTETADSTTWPTFELYLNGRLADMQRRPPVAPGSATGGLSLSSAKQFNTATDTYSSYFISSQSPGLAPIWRFPGDPRANFLTTYDWTSITSDASYVSSTRWKGRQMNTQPRFQEYNTTWLNRDYVRVNPTMGVAPASIAMSPAGVSSPYTTNDASGAIAYIRNGPMQSIGELGNVFDPIQASDDLIAPSGGSPSGPFVAAGARTLRLGQPEFFVNNANNWSTNGRRAIELLDLFTVNVTNSSSGVTPVATGRININTASPEVLAATLSGITVASDSGVSAAALTNVGYIATNIVNSRPFDKLSDLYKIVQNFARHTNYSPNFASSVGGGTTNLAAVDRMREEAFGKFVQRVTTQSRTYRIVVIGETLDNRGKTRSRSVQESTVYFQTNSVGQFYPTVQYQKFQQ